MGKLSTYLHLHPNLWKFSLTINKKWLEFILWAIAPGLIASLIAQNPLWLTASFLAVCGILPLDVSFNNGFFSILYALLIYSLAYLAKDLILISNLCLMLGLFLIIGLFGGIIDNANSRFRSFSSWLIIGVIYGGVKLSQNIISNFQSIVILGLAISGIVLVIIWVKTEKDSINFIYKGIGDIRFIFNFKYILPIAITIILWHKFNIKEPQWLIWSSLSVVYPELDALYLKFQQRTFGLIFGVGFGLLISLILPQNIIITYISFTLIMLSLRMFEDYFPAYFLRCSSVVIYAGNNSITIAMERFSNVVIGGIIGLVCTYLLIKLQQFLLRT